MEPSKSASQNEQPQTNNVASASTQQFVMTIGDLGDGKSTFINALLGESKNATSDGESGVTQNFDQHSSKLECFENVVFIDSPGLNDPDLPLTTWIEKSNMTVAKENGPQLSLLVLLIKAQDRTTVAHCQALATLLSCVARLRPKNFVVVFNKCALVYTAAKGLALFRKAVATLDPVAQKSVAELSEQAVLLLRTVEQKKYDQEEVEQTIRSEVVSFVSERL